MVSAIKHITVQAGQTLADIAIQEYGTVEGMVLIMQANPGLGLTDTLVPGSDIVIWSDAVIVKEAAPVIAKAETPARPIPVLTLTEQIIASAKTDGLSIKTITVQAGQTIADIAIQEYGTVEGMVLITQANTGLGLTDALTPGGKLIIWSNAVISRVSELISSEPYGSQLQALLTQWSKLVIDSIVRPGITDETDPVFQAWLASYEAFSGSYNDLTDKPLIPTDFDKSYLSLTDTPDTYAGKAKNVPMVSDTETALDFAETIQALLTHMADFPASYVGHDGKALFVKTGGGVEFKAALTTITKAMVEAVLTGNISTHTHSQYLTAITKAMVEAVLTGSIATHTHSERAAVQLQFPWNTDFSTLYQEFTEVAGLVTQVDYWATAAKATKLFTKVITYTGDNATSIVLTDNVSGKVLTTTVTYSGSDVSTITKTVV